MSGPHQARSTEAYAGLASLLGGYVGGVGILDCPLTTTACLPDLPYRSYLSSRRRAASTRGGRRRGYAHDEKCDLVDEQRFSNSERALGRYGRDGTWGRDRPSADCPGHIRRLRPGQPRHPRQTHRLAPPTVELCADLNATPQGRPTSPGCRAGLHGPLGWESGSIRSSSAGDGES